MRGFDDPADLGLVPLEDPAASVEVVQERLDDGEERPTSRITEERSTVRVIGGWLGIDRAAGTATYRMDPLLGPHELVHPYLAPVGAVYAQWLGRESFHCAGVAVDGGVWALLGEKEAGKSTLVAWLAGHGFDVFADDLLVVDTGPEPVAHAGPRFIDLRRPTAERLGHDGVEVVRDGDRWRLPLNEVEPVAPFRGFVVVEEGPSTQIETVATTQRLPSFSQHRFVPTLTRNAVGLLDLSVLPTYVLSRPKRWDELDRVGALLTGTLAGR